MFRRLRPDAYSGAPDSFNYGCADGTGNHDDRFVSVTVLDDTP